MTKYILPYSSKLFLCNLFFAFLTKDWFSGLFLTETTTTVKPDPVEVTTEKPANSLDAKKWFEMIAAHMATMQSPPASTSTLNRTNVLKRVRYDDYQIWRIIPSTLAQLEFLKEYKESDEHENVLWLKGPAMRFFHGFFFSIHCFEFGSCKHLF